MVDLSTPDEACHTKIEMRILAEEKAVDEPMEEEEIKAVEGLLQLPTESA